MAPGFLRENVCPTAASSQRGNLAPSGPQLPAEESAPGMEFMHIHYCFPSNDEHGKIRNEPDVLGNIC